MNAAAVRYAIRELGRRAGAQPAWIAQWRVALGAAHATLWPQRDSPASIVFPIDVAEKTTYGTLAGLPFARYRWMHPPDERTRALVPDFVVHFNRSPMRDAPLFQAGDAERVRCNADILSATLLSLARAEEAGADLRILDEHRRFPAHRAAAFRSRSLERPYVDEYGLAFRQALQHVVPGWTPQPHPLCVKLSHDMDLLGIPFSVRSTAGHLYPRRLPRAFFDDARAALRVGLPAYLKAVLETARISKERGLDSAFYWTCSTKRTRWDTGYDLFDPRIRRTIETLAHDGFEIGIHPAYDSFDSPARLQAEVDRLRRLAGSAPIGGRQHFLRWKPSTWSDWERAGLAYDSSVGFADAIGFRAGTALPYHPWILAENRESALLEIPLAVMDCTPVGYMQLDDDAIVARVAAMLDRCRLGGGTFTLLWHNDKTIERRYARLYLRLLDLLRSPRRYDWRADLAIAPLPQSVGDGVAR